MTELSHIGMIINALNIAKQAEVGLELTYFDVIELLGHIKCLGETCGLDGLEIKRAHAEIERLREGLQNIANIGLNVATSDQRWGCAFSYARDALKGASDV